MLWETLSKHMKDLKVSPQNNLPLYLQGKKQKLQWQYLVDTTLSKLTNQLTWPLIGKNEYHVSPDMLHYERYRLTSMVFQQQQQTMQFNNEKHHINLKKNDIL